VVGAYSLSIQRHWKPSNHCAFPIITQSNMSQDASIRQTMEYDQTLHPLATFNPFSTEPVLQIPLFSLAQTWVHSYEITSWTKQAVYTNFQLSIDKTAAFNLTPSRITSNLTLTVSCDLNRPSWPLLRGSSPGMGGKQRFCLFPQVWLERCRGSD
jgi:hypothetical protein